MSASGWCEGAAAEIEGFIRRTVRGAGAAGVVLGLSGGVDSAVTAALCSRALGPERCAALLLPSGGTTPGSETSDGAALAARLGVEARTIDIAPIAAAFTEAAGDLGRMPAGNLLARIRASLIYYHANATGRLVAGTDDRSEYLIGYFTKHGDGASDMLPIVGLYKTEVQQLGEHLGVPAGITGKRPGAHLWPGHDAEGEIGAGYDVIDRVLRCRFDEGVPEGEVAARCGADPAIVSRIMGMHRASRHKREPQPACAGPGGRLHSP